jgi:hypothetical protein
MNRHARNQAEKREAEARRRADKGTRLMMQALRIVLDRSLAPAERIERMLQEVTEERLLEALALCDGTEGRTETFVAELLARHSHLKQYLPRFLLLPFRAEPGSEVLLEAIDVARKFHAGELDVLPPDVPTQFASGALGKAVIGDDGTVNARLLGSPSWRRAPRA